MSGPGLTSARGLRVRFATADDGSIQSIEVVGPSDTDAVSELHVALEQIDVEVASVEIQVRHDCTVHRFHVNGRGGRTLSPARHPEVQDAVLRVVFPRLSSVPPPERSGEQVLTEAEVAALGPIAAECAG